MNLSLDQIKKELALFIDDMPHELHLHQRKTVKFRTFLMNVLSLINSQEQRIKKLTEENERLMREKTALECVVSTARNQAKADTVRKMQERLISEFDRMHKNNFMTVEVRQWIIDQIAKEMLEAEDEKEKGF